MFPYELKRIHFEKYNYKDILSVCSTIQHCRDEACEPRTKAVIATLGKAQAILQNRNKVLQRLKQDTGAAGSSFFFLLLHPELPLQVCILGREESMARKSWESSVIPSACP